MPTVTEITVDAFAHCPDPRCRGAEQEPVKAVRRHTSVLYTDTDPNGIPGEEKSYDHLTFADLEDAACPVCERHREVTEQERPVYPNTSGQDPLELIKRQNAVSAQVTSLAHDAEVAELQRQIAERDRQAEMQALRDEIAAMRSGGAVSGESEELAALREEMAALRSELDRKANKTGPRAKPQGE